MPVCYIYRQQEGRQAELPKGRRDFKMATLDVTEEFYPDEHPQILEREVGYIFPLMEVEPTICIELKDEG